jgi:hypothetical protein
MQCNLKPISVSVVENQCTVFGTDSVLHFAKRGIHHRLLSRLPHYGFVTVDKTPAAIMDAALYIVRMRSTSDYDRLVGNANKTMRLVDCNEFYSDTLRRIDQIGDIARWEDARVIRAVYSLADGMLHASDVSLTKSWDKFLDSAHWDLYIPPQGENAFSFDYGAVQADDLKFSLLYDILSASVWRTVSMPPDGDKKLSFHELTRNVTSASFKYSAVGLNLALLSNDYDLGVAPFNFNGSGDTITQWCYHIEDLRIHPTDYEKVMEKIGVYFYCEAGAENDNS